MSTEGLSERELEHELRELVRTRAYKSGEFTLASGKKSQHYVNGKTILLEPRGAELFARWVLAKSASIDPPAAAIGGLELGAVPISCSAMALSNSLLRTFIVRKEKKSHGAGLAVEGRLERGDRVIVVDDVVTTGGSTLQAIRAVEGLGCVVVAVYCLVDREDDMVSELEPYGLQAAMTLTGILSREP